MSQKTIRQLLLACLIFLLYVGFTHWKHRYDRPWAYSLMGNNPLLVGKWQGQFEDPDGITKRIEIEITEPEEKARNRSKSKDRNGDPSLRFEGLAVITGKYGVENDRILGILKSPDGHEISRISFVPISSKTQVTESFIVSTAEAGSSWYGDELQLKLSFTYKTKTGAARWDSADDRFEKKVLVKLTRKKD